LHGAVLQDKCVACLQVKHAVTDYLPTLLPLLLFVIAVTLSVSRQWWREKAERTASTALT
jgi:hypothetical protein